MLGWFGKKRAEREKNAEHVLTALNIAKAGSDPEVFCSQLDAESELRPSLIILNALSGKEDSLRLSPIEFDAFVSQIAFYEGKGLTREVGEVVVHEAIAIALFVAARHIKNNPVRRSEVQTLAMQVIENLNRVAVPY